MVAAGTPPPRIKVRKIFKRKEIALYLGGTLIGTFEVKYERPAGGRAKVRCWFNCIRCVKGLGGNYPFDKPTPLSHTKQ